MPNLRIAMYQLLLCILIGLTGVNGKPPSAIIGGTLGVEKEFPYLVGLWAFDEHLCGGTIIDSTHILTAAHCVDVKNADLVLNMAVITGTIDLRRGNKYRVKSIKKHEMYSPLVMWKNDIAIITLRTAIEFNDYQKPVRLPTMETPANVSAVACGWGVVSHPSKVKTMELWKLDMNVIANSNCDVNAVVHDSQLCAVTKKGSGLCTGDSGGPLVSNGEVVGIVSWVVPCARGFPDVFTRVYRYVDWIKNITRSSLITEAFI